MNIIDINRKTRAEKRRWPLCVLLLALLGAAHQNVWAATDDGTLSLNSQDGSSQFSIQNSAASDVFWVNSYGGVQISSNAILPGTTFYQNGNAVMGGNWKVGSLTNNGGLTSPSGNVTLGGPGFQVLISSNAVLSGATFYSGSPINFANSLKVSTAATLGDVVNGYQVQITSNSILPGATFYNGTTINFSNALNVPNAVALGNVDSPVLMSSNTILPGTTFYQNGKAVMGGNLTLSAVTNNGVLTVSGGNVTLGDTVTGYQVQVTSTAILPGATFYYGNGPITFANALNVSTAATLGAASLAVKVTSNTILSGGAYYQNGNAVIANAAGTIGFFGATPITQPANNSELLGDLINLGLIASGGNNTLTLPGLLTLSNAGNLWTMGDASNIQLGTTNGTQFGTATNDLMAFYGQTRVVQPTANVDIVTNVIKGLGLMQAGGNPTMTLGTGAITCSSITATGIFTQGGSKFIMSAAGLNTTYGNVAVKGNGQASIVAYTSAAVTGQQSTVTLYQPAASGLFELDEYIVVTGTQGGGVTVVPAILYEDVVGSENNNLANSFAAVNVAGGYISNSFAFQAQVGAPTPIQIKTTGTATTEVIHIYAVLRRLN